jgi:hypothetical protein
VQLVNGVTLSGEMIGTGAGGFVEVSSATLDATAAPVTLLAGSHVLAQIMHGAPIFGSIFGADRDLHSRLGAPWQLRFGAKVCEERFAG